MARTKFTSLKLLSLTLLTFLLVTPTVVLAQDIQCMQRCTERNRECAREKITKCQAEATDAQRRCEEAGGSAQACQASYDNTYQACMNKIVPCGCEICNTSPFDPMRNIPYYCECGRPDDEELACGVRNYEGECTSPILVDVSGDGFRLTSLDSGVLFDLRGNGSKLQTAWTEPGSDDAWLVLDRNDNDLIDDGAELFGNFTAQPDTCKKNGFLALAEFDKPANGGNGDGVISSADSIFTQLRLWQDLNHNGLSESNELITLATAEVLWLELAYKQSPRRDEYGNGFRYRAKVKDAKGVSLGRWAWDVWLMNRFVQ